MPFFRFLNDNISTMFEQEAIGVHRDGGNQTFSALDEDDFQTLVIENKLGCDIYLKKVEQNSNTVDQLHHGDRAYVWTPPPRFSDRLNVADESREARYYVAIQILEAKVVDFLWLIDSKLNYFFHSSF